MKQKPNVEFDARMMLAHATNTMGAFQLKNRLTRQEITARAKWLAKQPEPYRKQVKDCMNDILAHFAK